MADLGINDQRSDWLEPQKPPPISMNTAHSRRENGGGFAALEFYRRVFLVSGACSIRHQLFLPADKSAVIPRG